MYLVARMLLGNRLPLNSHQILSGLVFLFVMLLVALPVDAGQIELHAAVKSGSVAVRIEFLGGAMGDRMKVFLRNRTPEPLFLTVAEGTIFQPNGGDVQRLAALRLKGSLTNKGTYIRSNVMELADGIERGFLIEVVCIDYHKNSPPAGQSFSISSVDTRCQRILSAQSDLTLWAYQSAIWMDRAGVSAERLQEKFKVPTADTQAAQALLLESEKAGVASLADVEISATAATKAEGIFSSDPVVRANAFSEIQSLDENDRTKLQLILNLNLPQGGQVPSSAELEAGSTLEELLPPGIKLPDLEIPETIDDILATVESVRRFSESMQSDDARIQLSKKILTDLRFAPHLAGLKARLPIVRITAAQTIARIKHPIAVEALIVALSDEDQRVQKAAVNGLEKMTGQSLGDNRIAWAEWWQSAHTSFGRQE